MDNKIAIVTNSHRGLGFALVKHLCRWWHGTVYLTCPNEQRGRAAVKILRALHLDPVFYCLDSRDYESVKKFSEFLKQKHGGLDMLLCNVSVSYGSDSLISAPERATHMIEINNFASALLCECLLPLMRNKSTLHFIYNMCGELSATGQDIVDSFDASTVSVDGLNGYLSNYLDAVETEGYAEEGWVEDPTEMSKIGLYALSKIYKHKLKIDPRQIEVKYSCPTWFNEDVPESAESIHRRKMSNVLNQMKPLKNLEIPRKPDDVACDLISLSLLPTGLIYRHRETSSVSSGRLSTPKSNSRVSGSTTPSGFDLLREINL